VLTVAGSIGAAALTVYAGSYLFSSRWSTIEQVLRDQEDLSVFHGFWSAMEDVAKEEEGEEQSDRSYEGRTRRKPDLNAAGPGWLTRMAASMGWSSSDAERRMIVVFAPSNDAFVRARADTFNYDRKSWRTFMMGHVAITRLPRVVLEQAGQIQSISNTIITLDCIRTMFSDGSWRIKPAIEARNGLVYKIDRVIPLASTKI